MLAGIEEAIAEERPDALLVLGDTNSCIAALMARRMKVPVYHMEAGNRCFDQNVPEETNRRMVDHVSDFNLVYTEHARRNLLAEGLHPRRILHTGSPMREVLDHYRPPIDASTVLRRLDLDAAAATSWSARTARRTSTTRRGSGGCWTACAPSATRGGCRCWCPRIRGPASGWSSAPPTPRCWRASPSTSRSASSTTCTCR